MLITMSISRAPSKIAALRFVALDVRGVRAEREADDRADTDSTAGQQPRAQGNPGRVDADRCELELRSLAAQLLDVLPRGIRLQQRVIDHRRHAGRCASRRVQPDASGAGVENPAQAIRTAVVEHRVARAAPLRADGGRRQLADNRVDQPLQFLSRHDSLGTSPQSPSIS
jgi:hypothetical protein